MSQKILLAVSVLLGAGILGILFGNYINQNQAGLPKNCQDFEEGEIVIGQKKLSLALAITPAEQARGLSGCPEIPPDSGMLFPYTPAQQASFWMKDMLIPIDIIWIHQGKVVGIEHAVPPPRPSTPDANLAIYTPREPVDNVLEIKSGGAKEYGIQEGSQVSISD